MSALQLNEFTGSMYFTRWSPITKSVLTEGALYVAEKAGAYWLFDSIQSYLDQHQADWAQTTMVVHDDDSATLTMTNGNDDPLSDVENTIHRLSRARDKDLVCTQRAQCSHPHAAIGVLIMNEMTPAEIREFYDRNINMTLLDLSCETGLTIPELKKILLKDES